MKFGVKKKDAPAYEPGEGGSSGRFIKYFKKGEKTLRFLEPTDEWTKFFDHFSQSKQRSFPCTGDKETCPGCTSENQKEKSASCRFLVNALDPETGYVDLWKIPVSIIDDLERYEAKDGSISDRLYTVIQFKDDKGKVRYSVDREERVTSSVKEYKDKMLDHQEALQESYEEAWGQDPADEESPIQRPSARPKDEGWKHEPEDEDKPPFEQEEEPIRVDESEIQKMDADDLKNLFRRSGFRVPRTNDPEKLRERLLEELAD